MQVRSVLHKTFASFAEMLLPVHRQKLMAGIWTGYAIPIGFALLGLAAWAFGLAAWRWDFIALFAIKLTTNSLAWLGLRKQRAVMATCLCNAMSDAVLLTALIYMTGGASSPLVAIYMIEIAVLALQSNFGVTITMVLFILLCFWTMMLLMATGVLPQQPVPGGPGHVPSISFAVVATAFCAFVVGVPAYFSATTVRVLRAREAALEKRTAQLIQAVTQRSQFIASMTHELRTPIHGMQGRSDVIAAGTYGPVTDKQRGACASIRRSSQNLLSLIDDLLALARAEAGRIEARPIAVKIPSLVERVTTSVSWMVGTKDLSLSAEVVPGLPNVCSDERWLAHVLVNLVSNAVKFTPEGGRVTVRATGRDDAVVLEVIDTGIGIAPEQRAAIFEPFRQIDHGDAKGYGGVGLGLALVARLTDLLGAKVELESVVGKGSTFRVIVPVAWRGRSDTQLLHPPPSPLIADNASVGGA
jgi:signal transduction histidine kinase